LGHGHVKYSPSRPGMMHLSLANPKIYKIKIENVREVIQG
jgi:hypothetical protein